MNAEQPWLGNRPMVDAGVLARLLRHQASELVAQQVYFYNLVGWHGYLAPELCGVPTPLRLTAREGRVRTGCSWLLGGCRFLSLLCEEPPEPQVVPDKHLFTGVELA